MELRATAEGRQGDRRYFAASLRAKKPAIISEIKKASPSKGLLAPDFRPADLARQYEQGGAAAISVLTDREFFQGSLDDLRAARAACTLPVIRKDFTLTDYHVLEAAAVGADAVLLIVAILDDEALRSLREMAEAFGMTALVEAHNEQELDRAVKSDARIIGVNNRDLNTFQVSLETSERLAKQIPADAIKVSESGIINADDIQRLMNAGYDAFLVGEHLMKSGDAAKALRELVVV
jgi:indole-3-glycerol phosphate synthase